MKFVAKHRYARSSSQKIRLIVDMIRGKKIKRALEILNFSKKKAAFLVKKLIKSAIANVENNGKVHINDLKIKKFLVNVGPSIKRTMPRAKGRADRILKRSSHITVFISNR